MKPRFLYICLPLLLACGTAAALRAQEAEISPDMTFFVTSAGRGIGGNLGGLAGADTLCERLAASVGRGAHTWRAYLSAPPFGDVPAVNARDRIGHGPWVNARGITIASSIDNLHEDNNLTRETVLTEKGRMIGPGRHDILTGSNPDGTLSTEVPDTTCDGWTNGGPAGAAMLGHSNRYGGGVRPESWNSAHLSRGCSQSALRASLGDGLLYCFAAD